MPKMVSMKRESTSEDIYQMSAYPGGLCLYLSDDQCEQLGIDKALKPGTEVTVSAKAIVVSSTENLARENGEGNDVSLSLQITDLGLTVGGLIKNAADVLYGDS